MNRRRDYGDIPGPFPTGSFEPSGTVSGRYGAFGIDDALASVSSAEGHAGSQQSHYVGSSVGERTIRSMFLIICAGLILVLGRAAQIQVVEGARYAGLAEGNRSRIEYIPSERGVIYDRNGTALVRNVPLFSAALIPADVPESAADRRALFTEIADIAEIDPRDIETALEGFPPYITAPVPIADDLTHEQAVRIRVLAADRPALSLIVGMKRDYLRSAETPTASHFLGYLGRVAQEDLDEEGGYLPADSIGKTGAERQYETLLRGEYGRRRVEVDALGRQKTVIAEEESVPGDNLVLSIDLRLQEKAEEALRTTLKNYGKKRGSVVVMDPSTGEVLALVSEPAYDNNLFSGGISTDEYRALADDPDHPLFTRAISAALPSGSTFKLAVAAAALQEGIVTPSTTFLSTGGLRINDWFFPDWRAGGHGLTNLAHAIADSVNTYFYIIGGGYEEREGLGVERIADYARYFGLGSQTGIDLPGEYAGFLPSKQWKEETKGERWYIGDTYHLAIGQGDILVTPLQIAAMTSVFANGGTLYRPHMVHAVTTAAGGREVTEPETIEQVPVDPGNIEAVRVGMRQAVTSGSARSLSLLPVSAAAKTGTAQWSSTKADHAWFTSFAPYDEPELVVTVMVEEGEEGSRTAAPVARAIYEWWFGERLTLPAPKPMITEAAQGLGTDQNAAPAGTEGSPAPDTSSGASEEAGSATMPPPAILFPDG
jgi:penicillin-binding protein 2